MEKNKKYTFLRHLIDKRFRRHFENRLGDYRVIITSTATNQRGEFSIITYVIILICYIHLHSTGEYNKTEICKMADSRFVQVTDKEISEIKINLVQKDTKNLCKFVSVNIPR